MPHMQDDLADSAAELLSSMKPDIDRWRSGDEIDFQARYESAIQAAGTIPILAAVFLNYEDSTLLAYLDVMAFIWKDLHFSAWQETLHGIAKSGQAVYQFVWFASRFLRIDVISIIKNDANVNDAARDRVSVDFPNGAPGYSNWEKEVLENWGVDPIALWRRLESEGAPMRIAPYQLD